jgi:hypothetical protein
MIGWGEEWLESGRGDWLWWWSVKGKSEKKMRGLSKVGRELLFVGRGEFFFTLMHVIRNPCQDPYCILPQMYMVLMSP